MKNKRHFLSGATLIAFAFFAISSAGVNKIHYGAFNYYNHVEDPSEIKNFLVLNDGTKIYGEKITWKSGLLFKDQIKIDDQKFKIADVRGYQTKGVFYGRLKNTYIKRIVHGKINVYVEFTEITTTTTDRNGFSHTSSHTRTDHYAQKGENGTFEVFGGQEAMKKLLADCPAAVEMCDKSNRQMRKAIKKDPNYMNEIFDVYNNGCKPIANSK